MKLNSCRNKIKDLVGFNKRGLKMSYTTCSEKGCNQKPSFIIQIEHGWASKTSSQYVFCSQHKEINEKILFNGEYDWKSYNVIELTSFQ